MAYLAKKSRKRGGAYKKSRYAKRRMTGGLQKGTWKWIGESNCEYKYILSENGCSKSKCFGKKVPDTEYSNLDTEVRERWGEQSGNCQ